MSQENDAKDKLHWIRYFFGEKPPEIGPSQASADEDVLGRWKKLPLEYEADITICKLSKYSLKHKKWGIVVPDYVSLTHGIKSIWSCLLDPQPSERPDEIPPGDAEIRGLIARPSEYPHAFIYGMDHSDMQEKYMPRESQLDIDAINDFMEVYCKELDFVVRITMTVRRSRLRRCKSTEPSSGSTVETPKE